MTSLSKVNLDQPKFDQKTFVGRAKHFFLLTNPLNLLTSGKRLEQARRIVQNHKAGKDVSDEVQSVDELWKYKYLYDSAFHPETGEKSIIIGRMSAQMPMNMLITGCMMSFYKTHTAVIFWQWFNQTFNAIVNFTNRSGASALSNNTLIASYILATSGAMGTALSLNRMVVKMPPLIGRFVPFAAVCAANCINIPMMRNFELQNGVDLMDDTNRKVGISRKAAALGISAVIFSRIFMATPGMTLAPVLMNHLEKIGFLKKYPRWNAPIQTMFVGFLLLFATPLGCAFFRQKARIKVASLESSVREEIQRKYPDLEEVWYNKGL